MRIGVASEFVPLGGQRGQVAAREHVAAWLCLVLQSERNIIGTGYPELVQDGAPRLQGRMRKVVKGKRDQRLLRVDCKRPFENQARRLSLVVSVRLRLETRKQHLF